MRTVVMAMVVLLVSAGTALACNKWQLNEDLAWCFDVRNDRPGRDEMIIGAYNKDAMRLNAGFLKCQTKDSPRSNWKECSAGEQIDHARHVLGVTLIQDLPFTIFGLPK